MVLTGITTNTCYAPIPQTIALNNGEAKICRNVGKEDINLEVEVKALGTPANRKLTDVNLLNYGDQGGRGWRGRAWWLSTVGRGTPTSPMSILIKSS
jgi:hypothetical protein